MNKTTAVRTGYYTALNGNILYNQVPVKIYDSYAKVEDTEDIYIILSTQTSSQRGVKQACKIYDDTIVVDIITKFPKPYGRSTSELLAEQVDTIISNGIDLTPYGYQLGNTNLESDTDLENKSGMQYVFRKVMRYKHLIDKL